MAGFGVMDLGSTLRGVEVLKGQRKNNQLRDLRLEGFQQDRALQTKVRDLSGLAAAGDPEAYETLSGMDPARAVQVQQARAAGQPREPSMEEVRAAAEPYMRLADQAQQVPMEQRGQFLMRALSRLPDSPLKQESIKAVEQGEYDDESLRMMSSTLRPMFDEEPISDVEFMEDGSVVGRQGNRIVPLNTSAVPGLGLTAERAEALRKRNFDSEDKLRDEFRADTKAFGEVSSSFQRILDSGTEPSAAGDLALIFNYMKMLDPGSTVREGEFATAQNAGGAGERLAGLYNQVRDGTRLTEAQRSDFLGRSTSLYAGQMDLADQTRSEYSRLARRNRLDPENVVRDFSAVTVIRNHPRLGRITMADVFKTADDEGMDPSEVLTRVLGASNGS